MAAGTDRVPAPVTTWANEPLYLNLERVAAIFGMSPLAVQRLVSLRRFTPPAFTYPMRWSREALERDWCEGGVVELAGSRLFR